MSDDFGKRHPFPPEPAKRRQMSPGCLIILFGLFFAFGSVISYFFLIQPIWNVFQAQTWMKIPCLIRSSHVEAHRGTKGGTTYSIEIEYDYTYQGQPYHGDRYSFMASSTGGRDAKQAVVDKYPVGAERECFVNPHNPAESVINRDFVNEMWFGLVPLAFVLIGLIGMAFSIRSWLIPKATKLEIPGAVTPSWTPEPQLSRDQLVASVDENRFTSDGFVTLSTPQSGLCGCIAVLVFAGFWNGVVGVMLREVIRSFQRGRPEWFLTFFSIPFVLVGLLMLFVVVYVFLKMFNPRPIVAIRPGEISLGDSFTLQWRFTGQTTSIRQLKIDVIGKEKSSYRRGTSTYTDEKVFATLPLIETANSMEISSGQREVTIPGSMMHSFKTQNNEILWVICIEGDIAWWPDVSETYPVEIRPRPF